MIKRQQYFLHWPSKKDAQNDQSEGTAANRKGFGFLNNHGDGWTFGRWTVMGVKYTFSSKLSY